MRMRALKARQMLLLLAIVIAWHCQPLSAGSPRDDRPNEWVEEMKERAEKGNVESMAQLMVHYSLHVENDEASFYWILRLADAGETAERGAVLGKFCGSSSAEERAVGLFLAEKWGKREDCAVLRASRPCGASTDETSASVKSDTPNICRDGGD